MDWEGGVVDHLVGSRPGLGVGVREVVDVVRGGETAGGEASEDSNSLPCRVLLPGRRSTSVSPRTQAEASCDVPLPGRAR